MDINIKIEQVREICDHFLEQMEAKLDDIGIGLSQSDMSEVKDTVLQIIESDLIQNQYN